MTILTPTRQALQTPRQTLHTHGLNMNRLRFGNTPQDSGANATPGPDTGSTPQAQGSQPVEAQVGKGQNNKERSWGQFFLDKLSGFPLIGNFVKAGAAFFTAYSFLSGAGLMNKLLTAYPRLGNGLRIALAAGFALAVFFIPGLQNEETAQPSVPKATAA